MTTENKNKKETYPINKDTYDWMVRILNVAEDRLGINIQVHDEHQAMPDGQIFLFNHYARFETAIPPYIFYKTLGVYTRSIADKGLFTANDKLKNFLIGGGAVPNNAEGLLPFMAAEILKGRKVVIFPEGGMIKDRRVMDDKGQYRIFSGTAEIYRKQHQGAAILALTLDLFKRRILDLEENGDTKRLNHWCKALDMESVDDLLKNAKKPTNIVPSTITFYPMRIRENALSKTVERFIKNASPSFLEEMIVEGNILLRDTDMDIRFGKPLEARKEWHWWERVFLTNYFLGVKSLDELFSLRHSATTLSEQILARCIKKEAGHIRDLYMEKIYDGVTLNMAHVAAVLIHTMLDDNQHAVPCHIFHKMVHRTIKQLQDTPDVHLHKTIKSPRCFRTILENQCSELKRFVDLCERANLMRVQRGQYHFLPKLQKEHDKRQVRIENPVKVAFNEAEPVDELRTAVECAIKHVGDYTPETFAYQRFDDEVRIYENTLAHFQQEKYDSINKKETATQTGEPYLMIPDGKNRKRTGILLTHGFMSSPDELRSYAEELTALGYPCMGVRLEGHGTSPWDLNNRTHTEWYDSVRRGYSILSAFVDEVILVGFSTGGALSLSLAAENFEKIKGVASIATPVKLSDKKAKFVGIINKLPSKFKEISGVEEKLLFKNNATSQPQRNYRSMPFKSLGELHATIKRMKRDLDNVTVPVIIIQATKDNVVRAESAQYIHDKLTVDEKSLHWIESDRHDILPEGIGETRGLLTNFIKSISCTNGTDIDDVCIAQLEEKAKPKVKTKKKVAAKKSTTKRKTAKKKDVA